MNYRTMQTMLTALEMDKAQRATAHEMRMLKHARCSGKALDYSSFLEASRKLDILTYEYQKLTNQEV